MPSPTETHKATYARIGHSHNLVVKNMHVRGTTRCEVPCDMLTGSEADCQRLRSMSVCRDADLPELHVTNDATLDFAEGPAVRSVRLLLSVPPCLTMRVDPARARVHASP